MTTSERRRARAYIGREQHAVQVRAIRRAVEHRDADRSASRTGAGPAHARVRDTKLRIRLAPRSLYVWRPSKAATRWMCARGGADEARISCVPSWRTIGRVGGGKSFVSVGRSDPPNRPLNLCGGAMRCACGGHVARARGAIGAIGKRDAGVFLLARLASASRGPSARLDVRRRRSAAAARLTPRNAWCAAAGGVEILESR